MVEFLARETPGFMSPCCVVLTWWPFFHQRTRLSSPSKQGSNWQHRLRQASLYWRHIMSLRYVTTSKVYLTNSHILLKSFELVFLYNWWKFRVNWSTFEWTMKERRRGPFYEIQCTSRRPVSRRSFSTVKRRGNTTRQTDRRPTRADKPSLMTNSHLRRRRDSTAELSCVGVQVRIGHETSLRDRQRAKERASFKPWTRRPILA